MKKAEKIDKSQGNGVLPCVMASNYFLCEYRNWDGDKKIKAIEGESEEDIKHRIIGHGMELISVKRIYLP